MAKDMNKFILEVFTKWKCDGEWRHCKTFDTQVGAEKEMDKRYKRNPQKFRIKNSEGKIINGD